MGLTEFRLRVRCDAQLVMVATGVLTAVNPDRIILKKVMLTGYPVRARKRFAVVKYMFFDPLDVKVRICSTFVNVAAFLFE